MTRAAGASPGATDAAQRRRGAARRPGQRTRRSVAEALKELLRGGDPDPTARAVAKQAGLSLRLVLHHFADLDDLYQFPVRRRPPAAPPVVRDAPALPALPRPTRIERTIGHRAALFEETFAVRCALACRAPSSGVAVRGARRAMSLMLTALCAGVAEDDGREGRHVDVAPTAS